MRHDKRVSMLSSNDHSSFKCQKNLAVSMYDRALYSQAQVFKPMNALLPLMVFGLRCR